MSTPHAVVSGGSIAGLSAAFWLRRIGWQVTLIERSPAFREGGQNVDVRGVAHDVLDRMGLTPLVAAQNTTETGTVFVDEAGAVTAELPSDGPDSATAELEILRGDFARVIFDTLPSDTEVLYGQVVDEVDDQEDSVTVTTSSGSVLRADLLVVAEGVRSTTRDLLFGDLVDRRELGITMVFGTIPRTADDDDRWRWLTTVEGRQVHLRPDNHGTTRAILAYTATDDLAAVSSDEALSRLRQRYAGVGWAAPRILDAFETSDDVYIDHLTQIRMPTWHQGRVCVIGDAAWCVTPMGGGGASLALTSGYVLAAYLSSADLSPADHGPLADALNAYEAWMRPLVDDVQTLPPGINHIAYPQTALGLKVRRLVDKAVTSPPLAPLAAKITQVAGTAQPLPAMTGRRSSA